MPTLICFHAHPDDESLTTGGIIARYASRGHRVVVVIATGGELGEVPKDLGDASLVDRRREETECSARALGAHRVAWLGYRDSGMTGWEDNGHAEAFMNVDADAAATRLAGILVEEHADTLTVYDWHGNYGHPDHIKVHHVGHRAAELAGTPYVYEATANRDVMRGLIEAAKASGMDVEDFDPDGPSDDGNPFGTPDAEITTAVDVSAFLAQKRASIACHQSQISDTSMFLTMPEEVFAAVMGTEWFIRVGATPDSRETELAGL
ncbi:MAG: PIG-L family deacetylase [Acidimicrobiia bacterium]|nr:PIG-L family deacetylase [Acidimicrobiia bacterium]